MAARWLERLLGVAQNAVDERATAVRNYLKPRVEPIAQRVAQNINDLPKGIQTAVVAPYINSRQRQADLQADQEHNALVKELYRRPDPITRAQTVQQLHRVDNRGPVLEQFNPKAMDSGYAKRIGGTFFDVASLPVGAAESFTARLGAQTGKTALEKLAQYGLLRGAEAVGIGGVRDIATGEGARAAVRNAPARFAFGAGVNTVLSPRLTANAIKELPDAVREVRAVTRASAKPGMAPGFAQLPEKPGSIAPDEKVKILKDQLDVIDEAINSHPGKDLIKYTNRNGELPEVTGKAKSQFGSQGDVITADTVGKFGNEELNAGAMLDEYKNLKAHQAEIKAQYNQAKTEMATTTVKTIGKIKAQPNRYYDQPEKVGDIIDRTKLTGKSLETPTAELQAASRRAETQPQPKNFEESFQRFVGQRESAKTKATILADDLNKVPKELHKEVINGLEGQPVSPQAQGFVDSFRKQYDQLFSEAQRAGVDINYLENYITHIWEKSPQEVSDLFQSAKGRFGFATDRVIPTYEEGLKMGLKAKYTNPAQIVGEYARKLEETKAGVELVNRLRVSGDLLPSSAARGLPGLRPVVAPGLPEGYMARPEVAKKLNKVFSPDDTADSTIGKIFEVGAKVSGGGQDILLSGGVPGTPINAFTIAQMTKEIMGGRVKSPLVSLFRSIAPGKSKEFFAKNAQQIIKLQERGISVGSNFDYDQFGQKTGIKKILGNVWSKVINEPTFKRFMPMLQVNLFNDVEKSLIKAGKAESGAADIAAKAVQNFYGTTSTAKVAGRSKISQDATSALLFAPRYRESMVNFWINNLKALKNPLAPENRTNAIFGVSAVLTYLAMNNANAALNGHGMNDNPKGKEDKLLVPLGNGKTIGIPYLSSIATVPRSIYKAGKNLVEGDIKQAGKEIGSSASIILRPLADVAGNEDYFGSPIYDENAPASEKYSKIANYLLNPTTGSFTHPWLREGIKFARGEQGLAETISKGTEMPLRWYDSNKLAMAPIWEDYFNLKGVDQVKSDLKIGKITPDQAAKKIDKLTGSESAGLKEGDIIPYKDSFMYKTSKGYDFADSEQEAQQAIAKDQFSSSGEKTAVIGDKFWYKDANGELKSESVKTRRTKLEDAQYSLDKQELKANENYKGYMELLSNRYKSLESRKNELDPEIDQADIVTLTNQQQDILAEYSKLAGYKGFKKPKKPKKSPARPITSTKLPPRLAPRAARRRVSSFPKARAVPRVSPSYLANLSH